MKRLFVLGVLVSVVSLGTLAMSWSQEKTATSRDELKALVQGNNAFAFDLYARLSQKKGNVVFSPYSISNALAMTYAGARGQTAEEMAKVLHFTLGQERLHPAFAELVADLYKDGKGRPYHLHVANSLWGQKGYPFLDGFLELTRKNYRAGLKEVDFERVPEEARHTVNRWVEEQTRDKIKELLLSGDVTPSTRLVLTNAIYFKATWQTPFPKDQTRDAVFAVAPGEKPSVPMMRQPEGMFRYFAGDNFQWLELPYKGGQLSLVVLLPHKQGRLAGLEKALTASAIQRGVDKLQLRLGEVALPRFQATLRVSLGEDLKQMGMPLAFSRGADFSGIASAENLRLTGVIHKAFIDVDEVGTEASAATAVVAAGTKSIRPFSFRADHPFLFLIRDTQTGSILFLGRVTDPRP
jgi:serpin B